MMTTSGRPGLACRDVPLWRMAALLVVPAVLLLSLMVAFAVGHAALRGRPPGPEALERALPFAILVNHLVVLALLVAALRAEGRTLADVGWRLEHGAGGTARQIAVALFAALGLYLGKELILDSLRAVLAGARPTFHSLFDFTNLERSEYGLLAAGTLLVFVEESLYRGYAMPRLRARWGRAVAVIVSSLAFGLLHAGNGLLALAFTSCAGVFYALIFATLARRRLWGLTAGHALYNAMVLMT